MFRLLFYVLFLFVLFVSCVFAYCLYCRFNIMFARCVLVLLCLVCLMFRFVRFYFSAWNHDARSQNCRLPSMNAWPGIFLFVWCARVRNSFSARAFLSNCFYGSFIVIALIWCTLVRLWIAFTFLFLLSDSILRCVCFALVSFVLVYRYGFLSCLTFFLCCLVLSMSETQSYAWVPSLVVFVFAAGPIMFSMGAVALGSICWPAVVLWNWFQWW